MKKIILLCNIFLLLCLNSFSQKFSQFQWDSDEVTISSVEMTVSTTEPKKLIFEGFKNGKILISNNLKSFPTLGSVSIKLGGYFEMDRGSIYDFKSEVKKDLTTLIKYSVEDGNKFAVIFLTFDESQKLIFVNISATKELGNEKVKPLSFILKGFD